MKIEFENGTIDFVQVPTKEEGVAAFITALGTAWADSACAQRAQTSCRTTANNWFKQGYTFEQAQAEANSHTLGRGGPRKTDAEKVMTKVDKLSPAQRAELRAMLDEEGEREAAEQEAAD